MQAMVSRLMDGRRSLVVGVALLLGFQPLSVSCVLKRCSRRYLQPVVSSPLVDRTDRRAAAQSAVPDRDQEVGVDRFCAGRRPRSPSLSSSPSRQGGIWGARRDVIERAVRAMMETAEALELLVKPEPRRRGSP